MKNKLKFVLTLYLCALPLSVLSAKTTLSPKVEKVERFIQNISTSDYDRYEQILRESSTFDLNTRLSLYTEHMKQTQIPLLLNLTGTSLGHFVQGDWVSGLFSLCGKALSIFVIAQGNLNSMYYDPFHLARYDRVLGSVFLSVFVIYDFVEVQEFAKDYNFRLKKALGLSYRRSALRLTSATQISDGKLDFQILSLNF